MAKSGVIYTNAENVRAHKIFIAAKYSGACVKRAEDFVLGETNKKADYLAMFPCGSVPAFKSSCGKLLTESNAIAYYVANDQLRGKNEYDTARILQWVNIADSEITPSMTAWAFDNMGIKKAKKEELEHAKAGANHALAILDDYLRTRTYLVGEHITLADISVYCALLLGFKHCSDAEYDKKYVNVYRWFTTCVNQPQAKEVLGDVLGGRCAGKDSGKKKEEPKKAAAAKDDAEDDGEEKKAPESDPFGALPPGAFKMDDWKRTFSNNDFTSVSLPYFWQHFDKSCYSMWFAEYKPEYAKDLTQVFMTCNLVTGMYQRLDRMRKHSFGVMDIFGTKNDNTIAGFWIWRGQDLAFNLSEDLQVDYESYDWRKVDPDSDEAKKMVTDYFGRNDQVEFKGKKFNQCFVWK